MQDIADRVGISKATVSLVLNGKAGSRVSAATQKKVLEAAAELDYAAAAKYRDEMWALEQYLKVWKV